MEIFGYIASLFIGISLGLVGAGGSILTVPVMVYLFHIPVMTATSYSLFIVGATSLMGACYQVKQDHVNGKVAITFSLVSLTMVFLVRYFVLPGIPPQLFVISGVAISYSLISMLLFSMLMILASRAMIRKKQQDGAETKAENSMMRLLLYGLLVGLVTGFLGAGGGFILIPALVLLLGFTMKDAIGTSLLIIAINSLFGFALDMGHILIDWQLLLIITGMATGGLVLGIAAGKNISAKKLKISFGWMIMLAGIMIMVKELAGFFTSY